MKQHFSQHSASMKKNAENGNCKMYELNENEDLKRTHNRSNIEENSFQARRANKEPSITRIYLQVYVYIKPANASFI